MTNQFSGSVHRLRRQREQADEARRVDRDTADGEYQARERERQAAIELRRHGENSPARLSAEQRAEVARPMRELLAILREDEGKIGELRAQYTTEVSAALHAGDVDLAAHVRAKAGALEAVASDLRSEVKRAERELAPWAR